MTRRKAIFLTLGSIGIGILLVIGYLLQPITIWINNESRTIRSFALTPGSILSEYGIIPTVGDMVSPEINSLYIQNQPIVIKKISAYTVFINNQPVPAYATDTIPANVLKKMGVELYPMDKVVMDGKTIDAQQPVQWRSAHTVQVFRSYPAKLKVENGSVRTVSLRAREPQDVIWQLGLGGTGATIFREKMPGDTSSDSIYRINPPIVDQGSPNLQISNNSGNLGSIYAFRGFAPQGLDQMPQEDIRITSDFAPAQVVRIDEQLKIIPKSLPFAIRTELDPNLELDQVKPKQSGAYGVSMQLTRIRNQNGEKINEKVESETVIQSPVDEVTGYGTKVKVQTMSAGGRTFEYYRAISMYATSYSPCNLGTPKCNSTTASGMQVKQGVVAVLGRWYSYMVGQEVYIPGYGFAVIGDLGGGIPGTHWIDLGYSDEDFIPWHSYVTVYFLTPVPSSILYDL